MDVDGWIERLRRCELLLEYEVKLLCDSVIEILIEEANVQRVDSPGTSASPTRRSRSYSHPLSSRLDSDDLR